MSILTSSSASSVSRGYNYYKNSKVNKVSQLNDHEFEGYVDGSLNKPYHVRIDIKHPKKSYCDCPHANGNIICKHMVALYFELFPDEVEDYESWISSYDEEYENYYYEDYSYKNNFEKPLFFDVILEKFVENLNIEELRKILLTELKSNEERTFRLYLKKNYKIYLEKCSETFAFLDKLYNKVQDLTNYYNYDYNDFDKIILTSKDKIKIENLYKSKNYIEQIDKILLNEKLSVYSDYKWIASFYKSNKTQEEREEFCEILENYLNNLKHYSIKNIIPKSNVLITIYLLKDLTISQLALSLLKNAKYFQYIDYIIENSNNVIDLYKEFIKLINNNYLKNKMYIPEVLYRFAFVTDFANNDINTSYYIYSYMCLGEIEYLKLLSNYLSKQEVIKLIENKTKNIFLLIRLYKFYNEIDKLWNLLKDSNHSLLLLENIDILKDKYNNELYNYFINEFYKIISVDKSRKVYHEAVKYIEAISKLNNGNKFVNDIIMNLKKSEYQKCLALFDEINKVIKNKY